MNSERINQLVEQCGFRVTEKNGQQLYSLIELVVRECIEQLNIPNVPAPIFAGLNLGKVAIKEHFGVEE